MALAEQLRPDAVADVHSLGGSDVEAIIAAHTTRSAADETIHHSLATELARSAARRGYPFDLEAVPFAKDYNNFLCGACYERFHSLAFGMEVNHLTLTPAEAGDSAVAAIAALLEAGNRRRGWQEQAGYPNEILIGGLSCAVRPAGSNAHERARSRCEIWRNRGAFTLLRRAAPDGNTIRLTAKHPGYSPAAGWALCCRVRGRRTIRRVQLNRRPARHAAFHDECSTYVSVPVQPGGPESHELAVEL
jgi:hypothetical protein